MGVARRAVTAVAMTIDRHYAALISALSSSPILRLRMHDGSHSEVVVEMGERGTLEIA